MLRAAVSPDGDQLSLSFGDAPPTRVHALWLRDACQCSECRRPATNERLLDSAAVPLDLVILDAAIDQSAEIDDTTILLEMSDGHEVRLAGGSLRRHVGVLTTGDDRAQGHRLWPVPPDDLQRFDRASLDSAEGLIAWIDAILSDGAAVLSGVERSDAGMRAVASLIGEIRATNYGVTWEIAATVEPVSAVESERQLRVHTDLPYRRESPGIQLLLAAVTDVEGGASTLVDGYAAAETLRSADPEAWELLTRIGFTFPYVRDHIEIHGAAPLIGLRRNGSYGEIRRAPDLVGVPIVHADETLALYRALRTWNTLLDDPARELRVSLAPGDLLAFDNHRLLHGRTAFDLGARGRRQLLGCYLDHDDLISRRAVAARPSS